MALTHVELKTLQAKEHHRHFRFVFYVSFSASHVVRLSVRVEVMCHRIKDNATKTTLYFQTPQGGHPFLDQQR